MQLAMRFTLTVRVLACALMIFSLVLPRGVRGDHGHDEYAVKAAFLYNFAALVTWPASAFSESGEPLAIAILGAADFAPHTEEFLEGRKVGGRPIQVNRIASPKEIIGHHMVFVSASENDHLDRIVEVARGSHALTIGESESFARYGGIINFYRENNKIRFEINRPAAEAAGLRISSRLLRLARLVSNEGD